ncbi:zinc ribbon domain-containing protein [Chloroflexota bacterium]
MPIYDFRCRECGKMSEVFVRGTEGGDARCPDCASEDLERLVSTSYMIRTDASAPGTTCCGKAERCEAPPCSKDDGCQRS